MQWRRHDRRYRGHIDHGKTTLVRALTGVDTDRLPEEKKRGISIELGYAYLDAGAGRERIGFIDVPGHERLVATMLAGATGIDYALLLVAADDGVMPQTREHLAALALLGIGRGAIVVTKADRADAARVAEVCREARALVEATPLGGAPLAVVSASTGEGIDALRALLVDAADAGAVATHESGQAAAQLGFRLAVDRVFSLAGAGTVVTGTAHAGRVAVGDMLCLAPGPGGSPLRVRSIHAQNMAVDSARAGQRVALALAGVPREAIARGDWLVAPGLETSSSRVDARIELWRGEARPLRSGQVVHVHLGAGQAMASVAVLDTRSGGDAVEPGSSARVQLVLHTPLAAWHGERLVLRDASASRTIGGGSVLDLQAPARYRRTPERLALLDAAELESFEARRSARLALAEHGVDFAAMGRNEGRLADPAAPAWPPGTLEAGAGPEHWAWGVDRAAAGRERLLDALAAFHAKHPGEPGPDAARLRRLAAPRLPPPLWRALLDTAAASGAIGLRGAHVFLPRHEATLSAAEQRLVEKALPQLAAGGFDPPWLRTLAADLREPEALLRTALQRAAQRGELHQVVKDLYYPAATLVRAAGLLRAIADSAGGFGVAAFRDASGLGRKRAIQIVEYFDRVGLLRRIGDVHRLRADCELFPAGEAS